MPTYPSYGREICSGWLKRWSTVIGPVGDPFAKREVFSRVSIAAPQMVIPDALISP